MLELLTRKRRRCTTRAVLEEISRGVQKHHALQQILDCEWLEAVPVDGLEELAVVAEYMRRLGSGQRDMGEVPSAHGLNRRA